MIDFEWSQKVNSVHVLLTNEHSGSRHLVVTRIPSNVSEYYEMNEGVERLILSRSGHEETGMRIGMENETDITILPVLDRAHFPVLNE